MTTPLLLVATATRWLGAARMPRPLANAGFEVSLLAPKDSLAERSRFITKVGYLPDRCTQAQWVRAFAAMVKTTSARLVVPCDDAAFRLLQMLVISPPPGLVPAPQLAALIRYSLGDPAWYRASVEKTLLPAAAEALGVRVPVYSLMDDLVAARGFAAIHGYPVVLKRNHSSAGDGVRVCAGPIELANAFSSLLRPRTHEIERMDRRLLIQVFIPGSVESYHMAAWQGSVLTGYAAGKLERNPSVTGPSTVQRFHHASDIGEFAARLVRGFGITGFLGLECTVDARTGDPYLLEINRRLVAAEHCGSTFDVDHCAALYSALHGTAQTTRSGLDPGEEHLSVHFPQEWLRDPQSEWLRTHPVDVPWDEPELIEAMLALRNEE